MDKDELINCILTIIIIIPIIIFCIIGIRHNNNIIAEQTALPNTEESPTIENEIYKSINYILYKKAKPAIKQDSGEGINPYVYTVAYKTDKNDERSLGDKLIDNINTKSGDAISFDIVLRDYKYDSQTCIRIIDFLKSYGFYGNYKFLSLTADSGFYYEDCSVNESLSTELTKLGQIEMSKKAEENERDDSFYYYYYMR